MHPPVGEAAFHQQCTSKLLVGGNGHGQMWLKSQLYDSLADGKSTQRYSLKNVSLSKAAFIKWLSL